MIRKALTNYRNLRISDLYSFAKAVVKAMTGNASFPNPSPAPADFEKTIDDYGTAIEEAKGRDVNAIARRDALSEKVLAGLSAYGIYANLMAKGDVEKLRSSALELNKERTPTVLTKPAITVTQGIMPGSVLVKVTEGKGADAYIYQYTDSPNGDGAWTSLTGGTRRMIIENLTEGKQYWFRVIAIGSFNKQFPSDAVTTFVANHVGAKVA